MSLFVVGALHLDVIVSAPRLPHLDETLPGRAVRYALGGKGGNQAVAAARMGARVAMAGAVGEDDFAERLLAALDRAGVDRARVARHAGASGMSVAIETETGEYGAVIVSAANLSVTGKGAPPQGTTHVLLQNEIPERANLAAARAARAAGAQVILNAAPYRPLPPALLALTDILVVNRLEAAALAGHAGAGVGIRPEATPVAEPETAAALARLGPDRVVVTLGAAGLSAQSTEGALVAPAFAVKPHSSHGAGDAFVGAFAARLNAGDGFSAALDFARAAAALHVATLPERRAEIDADAVRNFRAGR